jgi:hypothetical protein
MGLRPKTRTQTWRRGSFGLPRSSLGLTRDSVSRSARTFEGFRHVPPTRPHRCEMAVDPLTHSPSEHSPLALTGSHRPPLMGFGEARPVTRTPLPSAPSSTTLAGASLEVTVRVHSGDSTFASSLRPRDATPEVSFRPRGFAPPRRLPPRSSSQVCCTLLPTLGFIPFRRRRLPAAPRDATTPRRTSPTRRGHSGLPAP